MGSTAPVDAPRVQWQALLLPALQGQGAASLAVRRCTPLQQPIRAQVVVAAAIGVPQRFYAEFAQWLAAQGYAVTTFDYRGHAESLQGPLQKAHANLLDWAQDCEAVAQHVRTLAPQLPLYWLGHSVGAQLPGMRGAGMPIDGLLSVASGSGYWRDNAAPTRRKVLLWWHVIAPVVTTVYGCLPGKKWGLVGDLPAGVVWQWRKWCMHPDYGIGVEGQWLRDAYAAAHYPVHAWSVSDDEMMSWRSTTSLLSWYSNCPQTLERLHPKDVQAQRIGHFGFFRASMAQEVWPRVLAVLERWQGLTPGAQPALPDASTVAQTDGGVCGEVHPPRAPGGELLPEIP